MSVYDTLINERLKKYREAHEEKVALLSDAAKMDKYVSGISQQVSPTKKMAPKTKADLLTDRVDMTIDKSSPMKGFGPEFRQKFAQELARPENAGYTARAIAGGIAKHMLLQTDENGESRLERAYKNYRVEESSADLPFLPFDKPDPKRKPPAALPGMPTYSEWKAVKREQEDVRLREEGGFSLPEYAREVRDATTIGAYAGAALGVGASIPSGGTAAPITVPVATAIGGLVAGLGETIAYPWRKYVEGTEWHRAREDRGALSDHAKTLAAKFLPDVVAQGAAEIKLIKSVTKLQGLKELAKLKPDAKTIGLTKEAEEEVAKSADKVNKKAAKEAAKEADIPLNKKKQMGVAFVAKQVKANGLEVEREVVEDAGKKWAQLSKAGKNAARNDPDGLVEGILKQYEVEDALKYTTGEKTADDLVKKVKPAKAATTAEKEATTAREIKELVDEVGPIQQLTERTVPRNLIEEQAELVRQGVKNPQEGKELILYQEQTGKPGAQVLAEQATEQELRKSTAGKNLLRVVAQDTQGEVIDRAGRSAGIDFIVTPEGEVADIGTAVTKSTRQELTETTEGSIGVVDKTSFFGKRLEKDPVTAGVADSFDEMGRPIDKLGRRLETESQKAKRLETVFKAVDDNVGGVFKEDVRSPFTDEILVSKGTVATEDDLLKIVNEEITPDHISGMMQKRGLSVVEGGKKATPDLDKTLTETEALIAQQKKAIEELDYSYATVTKKQLDEILEKGSVDEAGLTLRPDADKARSTKKGSTLVKVKKGDPKNVQIEFEDGILLTPEQYKTTRELKLQYDEIGDYYDELLVKHYPDLDLNSHEPDMIAKVMRKASTLQDELVGYEKEKLDYMLEKYDGLERAASTFKKTTPDISVDEMKHGMVDIMDAERSGKLSAVETIQKVEELKLRTLNSETMDGVDKYPSIEAMDNYLARLKKQAGVIGFFAAFGIGATLLDAISPDEAEAMPFGSIAKAAGKLGKEALESYTKETGKALLEKGLASGRVVSDTVFHLTEKNFMTGLKDTIHGGPKDFLKNMDKILRSSSYSLRRGYMSPQMQFYEILKQTPGKLVNPAVFKAIFYNAEVVNIQNGLKVASNIFKAGDVVSAKKELAELFKPLKPLAEKQYLHDYHRELAGELQKRLGAMKNPTKEEVAEITKQIERHTKKADGLVSAVKMYHKEFQRFGEEAAKRHSSSRVFFAADDSAKFEKYPFMKNIPLTEKELLTVGRLKKQLATYRVRLEKQKIATKSGAYMHYILHPDIKADTLAKLTGDSSAAPYLRNYTRSFNSRPMMPDAVESMGKYVVGTEKRLQEQAFWKSGWDKVEYKARHIAPLRKAFDDLRTGTIPYEDNFINNTARMYTNIEVFKRLFLLPSAGLKHLVKVTGDMSTLGPAVVFQSMGDAAKGVSHRIIQDTPKLQWARNMLDSPNQYTKMKKQILDSVAPARETRYRMMQMGFGDYDSMFSKLNVLADKVNHIGGAWINLAEFFDRSLTFEAGMRMAAKKGLTPEQAIYGIYDTLLKNNFLGREFTPAVLRHPVFKAFFMFQTTPAKILGKKLSVAMVAQKPIRDLGKHIFNSTKTAEGRVRLRRDLLNLWGDMQRVEQESKVNLILDTIRQEQDFYGTNVVSQFAKDLLVMGAGTSAAGAVGLNMHVHFFHLPFLQTSDYSSDYGKLSLSPAIKAIKDGQIEYQRKIAKDEDSMLFHEIFQKWSQKSGPFPTIFHKIHRISENDIPEIYQDSALQYLFAIPSVKEDH
jgi:hypothetical protein